MLNLEPGDAKAPHPYSLDLGRGEAWAKGSSLQPLIQTYNLEVWIPGTLAQGLA